jgi:predicted PurR-regulated permease PerM
VRSTLEPVFDMYNNLERFIDRIVSQVASSQDSTRAVRIETPNSMLGLLTTSAPHLLIQLFFALLVIFFFLAGWTAMRKRTIVSRGSFEGALTTARVIQQVVDATSTYLGTITVINVSLGALTALVLGGWAWTRRDVGRHRRGAELHPLPWARSRPRCCSSWAD